jgi:putative phosphoesterase
MSLPLRIFVLADTHNHLPANLEALADGADEIWHLGDVCAPAILETLEQLGPSVTVVRGNCDSNFDWPLTVNLGRNGIRFRLMHIPPDDLPGNVDVLLHGHTHVPRNERIGGVRFLNPGCVTRPNRGSPPSVAVLEIAAEGKLIWRTINLR